MDSKRNNLNGMSRNMINYLLAFCSFEEIYELLFCNKNIKDFIDDYFNIQNVDRKSLKNYFKLRKQPEYENKGILSIFNKDSSKEEIEAMVKIDFQFSSPISKDKVLCFKSVDLSFHHNIIIEASLKSMLQFQLRGIALTGCKLEDKHVHPLILKCEALEYLNLSHNNLSDEIVSFFTANLSKSSKLKELDLSSNKISKITPQLLCLQNVENLRLNNNYAQFSNENSNTESLVCSLKSLSLTNNRPLYQADSFDFSLFQNLEDLDISFCRINNDTVKFLIDFIKLSPSLRSLNIAGNYNVNSFTSVLAALRNKSDLSKVNLGHNKLSKNDLDYIDTCLRGFQSLNHIIT